MTIENNPLKQYFRRPSIHIKLPSGGKYYDSGVLSIPPTGELPVYPMTAIDEITAKTPDALFNGTAVTDIIKSCLPDIKDPWLLNNVDLDAVLIGVRVASNGSEMELESTCPACNTTSNYGINLFNTLSTLRPGDYDKPLQVNDLSIKFKPLTYRSMNEAGLGQFEIQRAFASIEQSTDDTERTKRSQEALKSVTKLTIKILTEAIEYIETPTSRVDEKKFIEEFLSNCDKNTYVTVRDHNAELKAKSEIQPLKMQCVECKHEYEQQFTLSATDFFE